MRNVVNEYFDVAVGVVRKAGRFITQYGSGCEEFEVKSCDIDFVTKVDKMVENFIIHSITKQYPSHKFIGEESVAGGAKVNLTDEPTWVIDPVDGTMNFVHGFPFSCISLALLISKEPVLGIIYNPLMDKLYSAKEGQGACLNGEPIHTSKVKELRHALVAFETGTSRDEEKVKVVFENFKTMVGQAHGIRALGSAALNMAMVAEGRADANFEFGIHIWDIAAGCLIVKEAGGVCIDPSGGPINLLSRRMLCAGREDLANELSKKLTQYYPDHD
ncbi:PREDICTED: inositol monophosphatase 1 [Papilio polytes]|uniref:inositol monophosphatase 1 n=1 Tax=Papilio polytes TaxID=76194 RepID=UPI000675D7A4|nr:PREDICTED: inositol monophosphatase 1 [Papilio polytes]